MNRHFSKEYTQRGKKYIKDALMVGEMQIETSRRHLFTAITMAAIRTKMTSEQDVEKLCTMVGDAQWYRDYSSQCGGS